MRSMNIRLRPAAAVTAALGRRARKVWEEESGENAAQIIIARSTRL
jgi:hypothetical protein